MACINILRDYIVSRIYRFSFRPTKTAISRGTGLMHAVLAFKMRKKRGEEKKALIRKEGFKRKREREREIESFQSIQQAKLSTPLNYPIIKRQVSLETRMLISPFYYLYDESIPSEPSSKLLD